MEDEHFQAGCTGNSQNYSSINYKGLILCTILINISMEDEHFQGCTGNSQNYSSINYKGLILCTILINISMEDEHFQGCTGNCIASAFSCTINIP